jgi:hypothetical protein
MSWITIKLIHFQSHKWTLANIACYVKDMHYEGLTPDLVIYGNLAEDGVFLHGQGITG